MSQEVLAFKKDLEAVEARFREIDKPKQCLKCGIVDTSNPQRLFCPHGHGLRSRSDLCTEQVAHATSVLMCEQIDEVAPLISVPRAEQTVKT